MSDWFQNSFRKVRNHTMGIASPLTKLQCMLLHFRDQKKINFYPEDDLTCEMYSFSVSPHCPAEMCATDEGMLLYVDKSKDPREVRWLDCRGATPKSLKSISTQQDHVCEMCYIPTDDKGLLISPDGYRIFAYNTNSGEVAWRINDKTKGMQRNKNPDGVTWDGEAHLFLPDTKRALIHVCSVDGKYMGCLIKEGEQGLGVPGCIRWCNNTSSLIVAHFKENSWFISDIKLS